MLWVLIRSPSVGHLISIHKICFLREIRKKNIYQDSPLIWSYDRYLRGTDTHSEETMLFKLVLPLSIKESTLKGKNLLPLEANSFLFEQTLFQRGLSVY